MLKEGTYVSERGAYQALPKEGLAFLAGAAIMVLAQVLDWALWVKFFGFMWVLLGVVPLMGESK